jgi:hypothetical protein
MYSHKEGNLMTIRKWFMNVVMVAFATGTLVLGSVPQATAETLKVKIFNHVTKLERIPIADVEGHFVSLSVREGVAVFENGDWAWQKIIQTVDGVKGNSTLESYWTFTFLDGATIMGRSKGTVEANQQGVVTRAKINSDVIGGTDRFQGIKGTMRNVTKLLPPEKGELGQKAVSEATITYTLSAK